MLVHLALVLSCMEFASPPPRLLLSPSPSRAGAAHAVEVDDDVDPLQGQSFGLLPCYEFRHPPATTGLQRWSEGLIFRQVELARQAPSIYDEV